MLTWVLRLAGLAVLVLAIIVGSSGIGVLCGMWLVFLGTLLPTTKRPPRVLDGDPEKIRALEKECGIETWEEMEARVAREERTDAHDKMMRQLYDLRRDLRAGNKHADPAARTAELDREVQRTLTLWHGGKIAKRTAFRQLDRIERELSALDGKDRSGARLGQ